jgi:hypothetical protein
MGGLRQRRPGLPQVFKDCIAALQVGSGVAKHLDGGSPHSGIRVPCLVTTFRFVGPELGVLVLGEVLEALE